jgi:hypothetical protein
MPKTDPRASAQRYDWRTHWPPLIRNQLPADFKGVVLFNRHGEYIRAENEKAGLARAPDIWGDDGPLELSTLTFE